jgi:hypothetical protein
MELKIKLMTSSICFLIVSIVIIVGGVRGSSKNNRSMMALIPLVGESEEAQKKQ